MMNPRSALNPSGGMPGGGGSLRNPFGQPGPANPTPPLPPAPRAGQPVGGSQLYGLRPFSQIGLPADRMRSFAPSIL